MLFLFVDPGPFVREKVEFATYRAEHSGLVPVLVPFAGVHSDGLDWLLLIVEVAEVLLDWLA